MASEANCNTDEEEVGNTEPAIAVEPWESEEEREQAKKVYIREYFNDLENEKMTKQQSEMKFIKTVRRIGWDDKTSLVENILNFVFDMKLEEAQPLGLLFVLLYNSNYINMDDIVGGLNLFCEFYSGTEMDAPMLNIYFAGITLKLIQANIITVEQIHESFSLDTMIDKKFKKDQIFGRRADYLANLIKLDNTVSCDPTLFLLEDANAEDWRAHYGSNEERTTPVRVLFVCTSNTCRSPMAEGIAKAYFQEKNIPAIVGSAGLTDNYERPGSEVSPNSVTAIMKLANIDISDHKSRMMCPPYDYDDALNQYAPEFLLTQDDIAAMDKIYCVSGHHVRWVEQTMGAQNGKVLDLGRSIPDPWHGPLWEYQECAVAVKKQVTARLDTLLQEL